MMVTITAATKWSFEADTTFWDGGVIEVSTDGGLIARGHPAGPTGVFQLIETNRRFRNFDDKVGICHLLGAGSTCITQILTRTDS